MAQPTNKIDELRARLGAEPKSRLFYPLAEELRKGGRLPEAEQILREGLGSHPSYVSAWVSLGRILKEQGKHNEAIEVLKRASTLDPANVVTARLLGESYLAVGDKVEAIKKLKLVHALLPADDELENQIAQLDRELQAPISASPVDLVETPPVEVAEAIESSGDAEPVEKGAAQLDEVVALFAEEPAPIEEAQPRTTTVEEPFGSIGEAVVSGEERSSEGVFETTLPTPQHRSIEPPAEEEPPSWMHDLETPLGEATPPLRTEESPFGDVAEAPAEAPAASAAPFTPEDTSPFGSPSEAVGQASSLDVMETESGAAVRDAATFGRSEPEPAVVPMPDPLLQRRKIERLRRWLNTVRQEAERV